MSSSYDFIDKIQKQQVLVTAKYLTPTYIRKTGKCELLKDNPLP